MTTSIFDIITIFDKGKDVKDLPVDRIETDREIETARKQGIGQEKGE